MRNKIKIYVHADSSCKFEDSNNEKMAYSNGNNETDNRKVEEFHPDVSEENDEVKTTGKNEETYEPTIVASLLKAFNHLNPLALTYIIKLQILI